MAAFQTSKYDLFQIFKITMIQWNEDAVSS